jgi:tetratricopeptide (TPR) repeat protein
MISGSSWFRGRSRRGGSRIIRVMRVALWALPTILAVAVLGGRAQAMQLTPVQKQEMKQHYEKATRAYDVQKYSEAVEEYQKAYEIGGDPAMLYNVAQSYRLSDQLPEALRFYRRYLQRSPNARNRDDVERKISDLERTIEERRKAAAAVPRPPPPEPVVVPPPPPRKLEKTGSSGKRIAGIVVASLGGAALASAAITGKLAKDKGDKLTSLSTTGGQFDPNLEANGKTLNTITIVSAIAGAAAVVTGAVLIVLSLGGDSEDERASTSPSVSPVIGMGLVGAAATVRF